MEFPSSPELGPTVVTFGGAFPKGGFDASSLPHPQGPTAAQTSAATVTHRLEVRSNNILWLLCLGRQSTQHSNRALGRAV
jgi:hypothetical protein